MIHRIAFVLSQLICLVASAESIRTGDQLGLPPVPGEATKSQLPEKIALGKKLFSDTRLSANGSVSCATCHDEKKAFSDGLAVAEGINKTKGTRNTPTLLNVAYMSSQFWDGRRVSLEDQARDPFVNSSEHGLRDHDALIRLIRSDESYRHEFQSIFGSGQNSISIDHVVEAIAAFERTLVAGNSPFDRFQFGHDKSALTVEAQHGLELFRNQAGCARCHTIENDFALFMDNKFHSTGVGLFRIEGRLAEITARVLKTQGIPVSPLSNVDVSTRKKDDVIFADAEISELGRFNVTFEPADIGRFKTPTLRNIALTAPYMHDGSIKTLEEVIEIELYTRGNNVDRPIILTPGEKQALVEFLRALTTVTFDKARSSQ